MCGPGAGPRFSVVLRRKVAPRRRPAHETSHSAAHMVSVLPHRAGPLRETHVRHELVGLLLETDSHGHGGHLLRISESLRVRVIGEGPPHPEVKEPLRTGPASLSWCRHLVVALTCTAHSRVAARLADTEA